jgi:hypothetical protein
MIKEIGGMNLTENAKKGYQSLNHLKESGTIHLISFIKIL